MAHTIPIHDTGTHFLIDPVSRIIKNKTFPKREIEYDKLCLFLT